MSDLSSALVVRFRAVTSTSCVAGGARHARILGGRRGAGHESSRSYPAGGCQEGQCCKNSLSAIIPSSSSLTLCRAGLFMNRNSSSFKWRLMRAEHRRLPFSISVDKNAAYPDAFSTSQDEYIMPKDCTLRRAKYLNNVIEQDHRFIKKKVRASQGFKRFHTAERTLEGIESVNMMRKCQVKRLSGSEARWQAKFVLNLFRVAA
ncbi:MAG TPA: DDE-type integrase/transposase/recombinase [Pyrinomonadaceae bacterium]